MKRTDRCLINYTKEKPKTQLKMPTTLSLIQLL